MARKAALDNMPAACCNRRGFSAEKRVLGPPLRPSSPCAGRIELKVQYLTASRLLLSNQNPLRWAFDLFG